MKTFYSNKAQRTQVLYVNKFGLFATLFLPFIVAILLTLSLFILPQKGEVSKSEVSSVVIFCTVALFTVPIILCLSLGMIFGLKDVSKKLINAKKFKRIGFGTIFAFWLSSLSKVHLIYIGFYFLLGLMYLIILQFMPHDETTITAVESLGLPNGQTGLSFIIFIAFLLYLFTFGTMAYIIATIPLAFISAIMFKLFTNKSTSQ